jgi:hypothetical protein
MRPTTPKPPPLLLPLLLAACLAAANAAGPARAATPDPYRAAGVPVDATAESPVAARAAALEAGQRDGLRQVLRRLTLPDDADRLPDAASLPVERYVQSFEIAQERLGPARYLATINVAYVPDQVRRLLRDAGVPFVERRPEPALVLPALRTPEGGLDLWGEANPWRAAWNEGAASGLVELRLPLGDAGDVSTATAEAVAGGGDEAALASLGERYGAPLVVVAEARPTAGPDGVVTAVEVEVRPVAGMPPGAADAVSRETVAARPGEAEAALLGRAVAASVPGVELAVKRRLIVPEEELAEISVGVPLADLRGWVQIRRTLGALPEVRSVRVDRFALSEAALTIAYAGDLGGLVGAVERAGLALVEEDGGWRLRRADGPGAYQVP